MAPTGVEPASRRRAPTIALAEEEREGEGDKDTVGVPEADMEAVLVKEVEAVALGVTLGVTLSDAEGVTELDSVGVFEGVLDRVDVTDGVSEVLLVEVAVPGQQGTWTCAGKPRWGQHQNTTPQAPSSSLCRAPRPPPLPHPHPLRTSLLH